MGQPYELDAPAVAMVDAEVPVWSQELSERLYKLLYESETSDATLNARIASLLTQFGDSVFSELNLYKDAGCVLVSAGTSLESAPEVIRLTMDEFRRFKDEAVTAEELTRAKNQLKGSLMLSLESTSSRMANLARQQLYFERFFDLDEILESIEGVTAADLQQVAADFFQPDKLALTALGELNGLRVGREDLVC